MKNPYTENFGKSTIEMISRGENLDKIYKSFLSENPKSNLFTITGPRGSGKTVTLTNISDFFKIKDDWIVADINPYLDLFEQLASELYDKGKLKKLFLKKEFNFSFKCFGFSIQGTKPVSSITSLIKLMLDYLTRKGYKVLITIDEVANTNSMKAFAHSSSLF